MAVQMLYQHDLGGRSVAEVLARFDPAEYAAEVGDDAAGEERSAAFEHAGELVRGTVGHADEIDTLIVAQADNWRLERMSPVDRNILRLAVYEFLYEEDVPKLVVIDEAIELAKRFGSENSSSFVNGVLDGMLKEQAFPGTLK